MPSPSAESSGVTFLVPAGLPGPSGGSRYNAALVLALQRMGYPVTMRAIPGAWPWPAPGDLDVLRAAITPGSRIVIDGLIACAAPAEIRDACASGTRVHVLFHLSLLAESGQPSGEREALREKERQVVQEAHSVICTSEWAAQDLQDRYGPLPTHVLLPGTDPALPAVGSTPPQMLLLASLTPRKNHLAILRALSGLQDLSWRIMVVGPDTADPGYAKDVREFVGNAFDEGRVQVIGTRTGSELESIWMATDLLLLVSRAETFGMVVTEALAHGIPAVVGSGTGSQEALALAGFPVPGAEVPPDDPAALASVLRRWLTDARLRSEWSDAAVATRDRLPTWNQTAHQMQRILTL